MLLPDSAFLDSAPVCCPPPPLFMVSSWPFPLSLLRCPMRINQSLGTEGKRLLFLSPLSFLATAPIRSEEDNKAVLHCAVFIPREEFCRISTVAVFMPVSPANMPCDKKGHSLERRRAGGFPLSPRDDFVER